MIAEGLKFLYDQFTKPQVIQVYEDEEEITKLIVHHGQSSELLRIKKLPNARTHYITTLTDFVSFLNEENPGKIFISDSYIHADFAYGKNSKPQTASVLFHVSEEYAALESLFTGVHQKQLWTLLSTCLDGCIDPQLLLLVSSLNIKALANTDSKINYLGMGDVSTSCEIVLELGIEKIKIPIDWKWTGSIWQCFDNPIEISLRLEIAIESADRSPTGCVKFIFHPKRLKTLLIEQREAVASKLKDALPDWGIYLGKE
jgi:hypothetical protein